MLPTPTGGQSHHASHSLESIHERIQQHAERLSRWETQFRQWQDTWSEREVRLDRELALLEAAAAPAAAREFVVVRDDDAE